MSARRSAAAPTTAIIPRATYRLQLRREFDFDAARAVLPYLHRLGISHVYCSPIAAARPGSAHGYDVVDPGQINPELGGREGFLRLAEAARALGMGLLIDQVPNHMGVYGADNPWWLDVLENGQASVYADHFDIDWQLGDTPGQLVAPLLGASYGEVLEAGDLRLGFDAATGRFAINYHEHRFPLDPRSYASVLWSGGRAATLAAELANLADAFSALPERGAPRAAERLGRQRELQQSLADLAAREPAAKQAIEQAVARLNEPTERDALDALIMAQAYRLVHWRNAPEEINYRRFFDVNDLAALRIEHEPVFEATHRSALELAASGLVDGLRIDHPDGLRDPLAYFERLQQGFAQRVGPGASDEAVQAAARPLYVVAEKIVASAENVPPEWAVHGTTGYRFAMLAGGLFVERRHAQRMERIWRTRSGVSQEFDETVLEGKRLAARSALQSQLGQLSRALRRIAMRDRASRDFTLAALREALVEIAAQLPVYRTYVDGSNAPSVQDRRFIEWAVARAAALADPVEPALFAFVQRCLLGEAGSTTASEGAEPDTADAAAEVRDFAMRFQQFSAPVAAKGVEDTAFYRYHRLVSLNEVGGDPAVFGISVRAFHQASLSRAREWPNTMLATSTHDNKRSEDVRNRISVLSEQPAAWRLGSTRWRVATRRLRGWVDEEEQPSRADQYLLLQILLGSLPAEGLQPDTLAAYRERIEAYMLKAANEAKLHTAWSRRNETYEAALTAFVQGVLGRIEANPVLAELQARAQDIAWFGALNSLSMTLLKFASPGVPDTYQGTELIDLSLVDPDNRRPVDFAQREGLLEGFAQAFESGQGPAMATELAATPTDGRFKLWIMWRLLGLKRERAALFQQGEYVPLKLFGAQRRHAIAFARHSAEATLIVVAGRKFSTLVAPGELPIGEAAWRDTFARLPAELRHGTAQDVLTGAPVEITGDALALSQCLAAGTVAAILVTR